MYKSFTVKNFRCFCDLTIEPLERVNLIAGKNNVGKTALLEALWLHQGGNNFGSRLAIDNMSALQRLSAGETLCDLFRYFDLYMAIELSSRDEDGNIRSTRITKNGAELNQPSKIKRSHGIILPAQVRTNPQTNAERLGKMTKEQQKEIVEILQYIEPQLNDLDIVPIGDISVVHVVRRLSRCSGNIGSERLIPLPLSGGGMDRLLSYALAIINAPEGIVLIDEVENALHYSVIAKIWRAIAELARKYDVQIFATTHSERCIRSAHQTFVENGKYDFRFHRLNRIEDTIRAVSYDQETLAVAITLGLEVR